MIESYVENFFSNVPYSAAAYNAKKEIIKSLAKTPAAQSGSFEELVKNYPDLLSLASLAGYGGEDVASWRNENGLLDVKGLKKEFRKKRRYAYLAMLSLMLAVFCIAYFTFYIKNGFPIAAAFMGLLAFFVFIRRPAPLKASLSLDTYAYVRNLRDKYSKKLYNTMFLGFGTAALCVFSALSLNPNNAEPSDIIEQLLSNIALLELPVLIAGKNYILTKWTGDLLGEKSNLRRIRLLMYAVILASAVYWTIVLVMFKLFNTINITSIGIAMGIYGALALTFNLTARRKVTYRNIKPNRLRAAAVTLAVIGVAGTAFLQKDVWLTQPYINTIPNIHERESRITYDESEDGTGIYTITNENEDGNFRILQLTDIHLGGSITSYPNDLKALQTCFELIKYSRPDLVVVTGDLTYPVGISSFSFNNRAPVMQFASFMRNTGVPWAFTYGNHDTESLAAVGPEMLNSVYMELSYRTSKNLLYPYSQPKAPDGSPIMGRSNQIIELRNADGSICSALFLIDSNAYIGQGYSKYDYIRDDQVDWYERHVLSLSEKEGKTVPSLAFFHIPLTAYRTAYELYQNGSHEVSYYFGAINKKIGCPEESGKFFETAVRLGSTVGLFCGHDHVNNISLGYKGIRLTYGMSIDYLVTPGIVNKTEQRGGTLIILDGEGRMQVEQIPYDSIKPEE